MRLSEVELVLVGLIIVYVAFFTNPVPHFLRNIFKSPVGHAVALGCILYVTAYESLIVGIFLAIAYVVTTTQVTEYMENPKKEEPKKPESSGVPNPKAMGAFASLMKKSGDMRLPQESQPKGKEVVKAPEVGVPKGALPKPAEHFANF